MSQQARNNPDSPEMQRASRDNDRAVFAAKMMARADDDDDQRFLPYRDDSDRPDLDDDDDRRDSARARFLDGVDNGNRDYI
jgi:hypothetical protein